MLPLTVVLCFVQTGALTAQLSDNPQKVNGLAGITLGAIIQSAATLVVGSVLVLAFIWKVALGGIGKSVPLSGVGVVLIVG